MMARLEADVLMSTIASKVARIELAGKPSYQRINWLRGLSSPPVRLERA